MITLICIILMFLLSITFVITSQYFMGNLDLTIFYAICMFSIGLIYLFTIRHQQNRMTQRLLELFDMVRSNSDFSDNDLSALEYKLYALMKSNLAISQRITEEKERMNGLISDVSHQIKTPLANIIMYSDLLLEDKRIENDNCEKIRGQAKKLRFLFDAMIKMSRCESGLITGNIYIRENNIKELLVKAVSDIYPAAINKNITICTNCDSMITAYFDMKWTAEAIFNILENAVKYSPKDSSIQINVEKYEFFIHIAISDQGLGISEEEQQNIWKRFYRGSNVCDESGVGIGLYLVKQILSSEHGYAKVKSKLGKGSTVSLYLPMNDTIEK